MAPNEFKWIIAKVMEKEYCQIKKVLEIDFIVFSCINLYVTCFVGGESLQVAIEHQILPSEDQANLEMQHQPNKA